MYTDESMAFHNMLIEFEEKSKQLKLAAKGLSKQDAVLIISFNSRVESIRNNITSVNSIVKRKVTK